MKKIAKYVIMIMLMLPMYIKAYTYEAAINKANNYIFTYNDYNEYIHIANDMPYNYNNSENQILSYFKNGGFISKEEYLITNINNNSYLATGLEYWTLSQYAANRNFTIDIGLSNRAYTEDTDIRITQFVQSDAEITGAGTKNNPWVFKEIFSVTLSSAKPARGKLSLKECDVNDKHNQIIVKKFDGTNAYFYICPTTHFEYDADKSSCKIFVTSLGTDKFELTDAPNQKLIDNMICTIDFAYQTTKVSFVSKGENSGTNPSEVYLANNKQYWFSDPKGYTEIKKITPPQKTGYIFGGYYTGYDESNKTVIGEQIVNDSGVFNTTTFNGTVLYPKWTPIEYYVTFNSNGGTGTTMNTIQCTYDVECPVLKNTYSKNNYVFMGWTKTKETSSSNTGTGLDKVYAKDEGYVLNLTSTHLATVTIYAKWLGCPNGTLKNDSSKGYICTRNRVSEDYSYACGSYACGSYSCNCSSCNCYYWCPDQTNHPECLGGDYYCSTCCSTCTSYCTSYCTGTNYYCPSGWNNYTGSGSSLTCYKKASIGCFLVGCGDGI